MHAPQWIFLTLLVLGAIMAPLVHGKTTVRNGVVMIISNILTFLLLWWGGFWSGA